MELAELHLLDFSNLMINPIALFIINSFHFFNSLIDIITNNKVKETRVKQMVKCKKSGKRRVPRLSKPQQAELTAIMASQVRVPKVLSVRKRGRQFCCQPKAEDEDTADDSHRLEGSLKAEGS